jgi:hypothetical protein
MGAAKGTRHFCAAVALLVAVLSGCGGEDRSGEREVASPRDLLVTRADILRAGPNSPGGTLLRWWRTLQSGNLSMARHFYANPVRSEQIRRQMRTLRPFIAASRPLVRGTVRNAVRARLYVFIRGASFSQRDEPSITETAATFRLVKQGSWKLADNSYLASRLRAHLAVEREERSAETAPR